MKLNIIYCLFLLHVSIEKTSSCDEKDFKIEAVIKLFGDTSLNVTFQKGAKGSYCNLMSNFLQM